MPPAESGHAAAERVRIEVPVRHPCSQGLLRHEWGQRLTAFRHVRPVSFPEASLAHGGMYRLMVERRAIGDMAISDQYTDAFTGVSGPDDDSEGPDSRGDLVALHMVRRGALRFAGEGGHAQVARGMLCVRDLRAPWQFTFADATSSRVLVVPRAALQGHVPRLPPLTLADTAAPEAQLFLAQLGLARKLAGDLSAVGSQAARDALLTLLAGLVTARSPGAAPALTPVLHSVATAYIDAHLRDAQLAPATIAAALHVSVRTLHRAFARTDETVMERIRRRRLERARAELALPAAPYTVEHVAARWHFADSSHFRRLYRRQYGHSPRASVSERHRSGSTP